MILASHIYQSKTESQAKNYLLILHGFLGMSDNWKTLAVQYAQNGFEVHALDLRNHGKSFQSVEFSYDLMVHDVLVYCQANNIPETAVLGHSMGGKLAMFLATEHPNLVNKLVVTDIAPKFYAPHHNEILVGLNAVNFSLKPTRADVEAILLPYVPDFGTRQFLLKNLYWETPGQLAFRFNLKAFLANKLSVGEALPAEAKFQKPTLFLRGGNSNYILDSDFQDIKRHFPQADIETIPNVGHWLHAENPALFLKITLEFLL